MEMKQRVFGMISALLIIASHLAYANDSVTPGKLIVEPPTLICLGFEWSIAAGDDNRNSSVELSYRKVGRKAWKEALPLLRIGGEVVAEEYVGLDYTTPRMFAGSIFDLEPGAEYECRLLMRDPDGVSGDAERIVRARTRPVPEAARAGRTLHVYPPGYKGQKQEPAFRGLKQAYFGSGGGDWAVVSERKVRAGDVILVHAGLYKGNRMLYSDPLGLAFHGAYVLTAKGEPDKPIVIRAAGDGEVIFDGDGCYRLFDVMAADYHIFEGLTIRNTDVAFFAGLKDVAGCKGLSVKNCRLEDIGIAVTTQYAGSRDFYIADNVILGRDDPHRLLGWFNPGVYGAAPLKSYYAIKVYGPGHVVCHNYIACFHDGICVCTHGSPDQGPDGPVCVSIDFYNNDIHLMNDDFIEADGGAHNIRIMRNRCFNAAQCGLSAQPVFGGPAYYIRNILYHVPWGMAFKFESRPAGLLVYHNTIIAENRKGPPHSNAHFRNNLLLGTGHPERGLLSLVNNTAYSSFDYNGYCPNRNGNPQFIWKAPENGRMVDFKLTREGSTGYATLQEYSRATGQEAHSLEVDYDIFRKVSAPDWSKPHAVYTPDAMDFQLRPGSRAVDSGCSLPNVNDGFTGKRPDLGALEVDALPPVYGPRTSGPEGR
jgi:hypothetical protein